MKFNPKISLLLCAIFLNCTVNAGSDDEMDLNGHQHKINIVKRKKFKRNTNLPSNQNIATKRTIDDFDGKSNTVAKTKKYDIYYDQPEDELNVQDPEEMDYLCDLLANIEIGASDGIKQLKKGNY